MPGVGGVDDVGSEPGASSPPPLPFTTIVLPHALHFMLYVRFGTSSSLTTYFFPQCSQENRISHLGYYSGLNWHEVSTARRAILAYCGPADSLGLGTQTSHTSRRVRAGAERGVVAYRTRTQGPARSPPAAPRTAGTRGGRADSPPRQGPAAGSRSAWSVSNAIDQGASGLRRVTTQA